MKYLLTPAKDETVPCTANAQAILNRERNYIEHLPIELFKVAAQITNPYELMIHVHRPKPVSRAYFKLWEILVGTRVLDSVKGPLRAVHLCEAPGAFVQATADYWTKLGRSEYEPVAVTLPDDLEWKVDNVKVVYADVTKDGWSQQFQNVHFVTGDGGFEISGHDKNNQETFNATLFHAQVYRGTEMLALGGSLVVKFFDMFTPATWDTLQHAVNHFETVCIIKPYGSRVCNSERYLVAVSKQECQPLPRNDAQYAQIAVEMAHAQTTALRHAIRTTQSYPGARPYWLIRSHRQDAGALRRARWALEQIECLQ